MGTTLSKVINVDFKNKKVEGSFDDDSEMRLKVTNRVYEDFKLILDKVVYLTDGDVKYQEYIARTLGNIAHNLKMRL